MIEEQIREAEFESKIEDSNNTTQAETEIEEPESIEEPERKKRAYTRQVERKMHGSTVYEVKKTTGKVIRVNGEYVVPRLQLFENEFLQTLNANDTQSEVKSDEKKEQEKIPFPTLKFLSTVTVRTGFNYVAEKKGKEELKIGYLEKIDSISDEKKKNIALAIDEISFEVAEIVSEIAPNVLPKTAKAIQRADKLTAAFAVLIQSLND